MTIFWSIGEDEKRLPACLPHDQCVAKAHTIHEFWSRRGSFPAFWSLIDRDKEKLSRVFQFFCEMQQLLETEAAIKIGSCLQKRLFARFSGGPAPFPFELRTEIQSLSESQAQAFERLDKDGLLSHAFELFVSGSLTVRRRQYLSSETYLMTAEAETIGDFEPDSGAFFFWAEFAFLASYAGFNTDLWVRALPILLRSEKIYALCYGRPNGGVIPEHRSFADYVMTGDDEFNVIHPDDASAIKPISTSRFDHLEVESTNCARFAFPGEFAD